MSTDTEIHIKGARANNLKNVDLILPKNQLIVVTGLSGSGKSSLIMDTLFAEGQRRYVESLSSYARQFLSRMKKPEVDLITGISPAIAIEQRVSAGSARSTVGSLTEIYDFLRLLYARIGKTYSPISGNQVTKHSVTDVVDDMLEMDEGSRIHLTVPLSRRYYERTLAEEIDHLIQKGYSRLYKDKELIDMQEFLESGSKDLKRRLDKSTDYEVLIDRFARKGAKEELAKRMTDSVQTAFDEGEGDCYIHVDNGEVLWYNNRYELDGMVFLQPSPQLFNYNNPVGACPRCEGYGRVLGIDRNKVIPDPGRTLYDGAIAPWRSTKGKTWQAKMLSHASKSDLPLHKPVKDLTKEQLELVFTGNRHFKGVNDYFEQLQQKSYKIQNRVLMARYRGRTTCPDCHGSRLNEQALYVQVDGRNIAELIDAPIDILAERVQQLSLSEHDRQIASRLLLEVETRLGTMLQVGLGYLTLDRLAKTLSGGETQRIHLTRTLSSNLTDSIYILDEPSIGLHPKDTEKLVAVLKNLRDLDNTVVVVEHEEAVIENADYIVDMGPGAGIHGGEINYSGSYKKFLKAKKNLTSDYLTGRKNIELPLHRRKQVNKIKIHSADTHNLKDIDVELPLQNLIVITGVSGSGKSTLVRDVLLPKLKTVTEYTGNHSDPKLSGDVQLIDEVQYIGQRALGKSSRSNPVTYVKAYDSIRSIMADMPQARIQGYKPKHFSFNVEGGRCETCKGDGEITIEMQFLADVQLICEECNGQRFKSEILEVKYKGKNIHEILELSVEEALEFYEGKADILRKIKPLYDVGLGYIKLGQASSTLSGGEAQRLKLASYLLKDRSDKRLFFIFDEPTTGLHFHDVEKLLYALNALVENGHTVLVVEHNLDVIKSADWIVDLGPVGGRDGGHLLYQGPPEGLPKVKKSFTGQFLADKL